MEHFVSKWISTVVTEGNRGRRLNVLDVGGSDYNGSYRQLFPEESFNYVSCDLETSGGVDIEMSNPSLIPVASGSFDLVISGQTFEHAPKFWELFSEMSRVCSFTGVIILIAPSAGPEHKFPVDCYRFYPDAFRFLAVENNLKLIDLHWDSRGNWNDLVGVFSQEQKTGPDFKIGNKLLRRPIVSYDFTPEEAKSEGERDYLEVLKQIHSIRSPKGYLEVGIRDGNSLKLSSSHSVAIDPNACNLLLPEDIKIFELTSNQFFRERNIFDYLETCDLAFIDGLHLFENVYQDFMNIEAIAEPNAMVIIDDIFPNTQLQGARERQTEYWMGDVWKFWLRLQALRPDLVFVELNTKPSGLGIVLNLDRDSSVLAENFNNEVRSALGDSSPIPASILRRLNSVNPTNKNLRKFLTHKAPGRVKRGAKKIWKSLLFHN
jgi:SAM-dependent methyltransferase